MAITTKMGTPVEIIKADPGKTSDVTCRLDDGTEKTVAMWSLRAGGGVQEIEDAMTAAANGDK